MLNARMASQSHRASLLCNPDSACHGAQTSSPEPSPKRRKTTTRSSVFFRKCALDQTSCLKFPALDAPWFGLIQERLSDHPFHLLVAVMLLNQTKGNAAVPVCEKLFACYPTVESIACLQRADILAIIGHLGLQNRRTDKILALAKTWTESPPRHGHRYRRLHYPCKGDGRDIHKDEEPVADDEHDPRQAWEIAHLPGVGAYAIDSWRIFCRDALRQQPDGLRALDPADAAEELNQEWTRVLPQDKELRAYIRWRWLRLGYLWNGQTGARIRVSRDIILKLERKELRAYRGHRNPWMFDFMATELTPDLSRRRLEPGKEGQTSS